MWKETTPLQRLLRPRMVTIQQQKLGTGRIESIRVQDIQRGLWFNWDVSWDQAPSCGPGTNALYVAVSAINTGTGGVLGLSLVEADTEKTLVSKVEYVATGQRIGIEWTGNMPSTNYNLRCQVTP